MSTCELEVDVWADDILNPTLVEPMLPAGGVHARIQAVPSLRALWEVRLSSVDPHSCALVMHAQPALAGPGVVVLDWMLDDVVKYLSVR
jgi:hypothetical protein